MNTSVCPGSKVADTGLKTERPSTRFSISFEPSALKSRLIVTDNATGTELHYSNNSAEELLNTIARALGKTVQATATPTDTPVRNVSQDDVTPEERKMEHRISEQKNGFATVEQLQAWGFNAEAIAECLEVQQRRMLPVKHVSLLDRRLGRMTNRA
jgi:hypothetical protein